MTTSINVDKRSVKQLLETGKNKRFIIPEDHMLGQTNKSKFYSMILLNTHSIQQKMKIILIFLAQ